MNLNKFKKIDESKIKTKKTISLISKTVSGDWKILIFILVVIFVMGLLFSWNNYRVIANQSFLKENDSVKKSGLRIDTKQLDRVVESFNQRKEKFNNLRGQN